MRDSLGRVCPTYRTWPLTVLPVLPKLVGVFRRVISSRHVVIPQLSQRVHIQVHICALQLSCLRALSLPLQQSKGRVRGEVPRGLDSPVTGVLWLEATAFTFLEMTPLCLC